MESNGWRIYVFISLLILSCYPAIQLFITLYQRPFRFPPQVALINLFAQLTWANKHLGNSPSSTPTRIRLPGGRLRRLIRKHLPRTIPLDTRGKLINAETLEHRKARNKQMKTRRKNVWSEDTESEILLR